MFVCLDLETTGLDPKRDHIIEVAIIRFDHEKILDSWSTLVKPPIPVPEFTTRLTGISNEMVADAPLLSDVEALIREKVGDAPIVGHFINFDTTFLAEKNIRLHNPNLDTCQLAQALLWNESSYSLQVLGEKLGITHDDAHRALDDVKANVELFWRLCEHVSNLSKEEKEAIRPLLEKSSWPWAQHLLPYLEKEGKRSIPQNPPRISEHHQEEHADLKKLTESLRPPFLFEEPSHTYQDLLNYALSLEGKSALVLAAPHKVPAHKDLGLLKDPSQYLDRNLLENLLSKDRLGDVHSIFGIKLTLWLFHTKTGEKSEMKLVRDEANLWFEVCGQEDESDSFYNRAKKEALEKKVLLISHLHFLKDRIKSQPDLELPENVVIGQIENFTDVMEHAWHLILSESRFANNLRRLKEENPEMEEPLIHLENKVSMLFGLLGIVFEKNGEMNDSRQPLIVDQVLRSSQEWSNLKESSKSIESSLEALDSRLKETALSNEFERYLRYLTKVLQAEGAVLWLNLSSDLLPLVHIFPENRSKLFEERVWKNLKQLHFFAHHGNFNDDFAFIKNELNLPAEIQVLSQASQYPLPLYKAKNKISSPSKPENIQEATHELKQHIPEETGDVFLLVTSMTSAEQFYYSLKNLVQETGRELFVQNMSGGLGKIVSLSEKTSGRNFFVGDEDMLEFLLAENRSLSFLALHRLPFAYPGHPITKSRSDAYEDAYKGFTIPMAALKFRRVLNTFLGNKWEGKKILVLDPRLDDYESAFLS